MTTTHTEPDVASSYQSQMFHRYLESPYDPGSLIDVLRPEDGIPALDDTQMPLSDSDAAYVAGIKGSYCYKPPKSWPGFMKRAYERGREEGRRRHNRRMDNQRRRLQEVVRSLGSP